MFLPKVHGWYSPYVVKVLETSMVCTLHGAWSIPNWTVRPSNCSPWKLWTGNRMKPSSMRVALSLLTFGRCSILALNQWRAWLSWRYHGDLMEIGMWTPQKLQPWECLCVDWLSSTHSAFQVTKKNGYTCLLLLPVEITTNSLAFSVENPSHCGMRSKWSANLRRIHPSPYGSVNPEF